MDTGRTARADVDVDAVFGALADPTRRDILIRATAGTQGISELAENYAMSFAAVQKHVAVLERAGLIRKRADGRRRVVQLDMRGLWAAKVVLDRFEDVWRRRVEDMHVLLAEDPPRTPSPPTDSQR